MTVDFANKQTTISQTSDPREDLSLLYESEKLPFQLYALAINRVESSILINFIYYLSDAPFQTPAPNPTMTPIPNAASDFIDKTFTNTLPNNNAQILIQTGSNVKQISGCHFININGNFNYLIRPEVEIQIFDNVFEYTDMTNTYSMPFYANYDGSLTIRNCRFINARCSKVTGGDGNVYSVDKKLHTIFDSCQFVNCGNEESQYMIRVKNSESSLQLLDCTFTFNDISKSCKVFYLDSSNVIVNGCTFTKCGKETLSINLNQESQTNGVFQFINNIVENNKQLISINNLKSEPVISGNIFRDITLDGYFISITHNINEITLYNNTFSRITSTNAKEVFGGGLAAWYQNSLKEEVTITYEKCKFHNLINEHANSPYNQGGAIQYGYTISIANSSLIFNECEFIGNQCKNGKGGAIAVSINNNLEISNCLFENNQAQNVGGAIYIWGATADTSNPNEIIDADMDKITITNCQFIGNKGTNGAAIFTEQQHIGDVQLEITGCTFTNNGENKANYMIVSNCKEVTFENNNVEYTDESKSSGSIRFNNPTTVTINDSNFNKCMTSTIPTIEFNGAETSVLTVTSSNFINCIRSQGKYTIGITGTSEIDNVTVSFDSSSNSNGAINFGNIGFRVRNSKFIRTKETGGILFSQAEGKTNAVEVSNCIFETCENGNARCFSLSISSTASSIIFSNNVIQNMIERGGSGYFGIIDLKNRLEAFVIENLTLINNTCNSNYGGGSGLWISNIQKVIFERCNFINNIALSTGQTRPQKPTGIENYPPGDGGGIQYGFTPSIYNIELVFSRCVFRDNKAVRHGGAIAVQMNKNVTIEECIFENNIANYQPPSSKLLYSNYFNLKNEGRGGAIYINPSFTIGENNGLTPQVIIEGCSFKSNVAYDGYAIYIEGEDAGTRFIINNNDFIDNYDPNSYSLNNSIITSEIPDLYEGKILTTNRFSYTDSNVYVPELLYVDHYGTPPTPSSTPIKTGVDISGTTSQNNLNNLGFDCVIDRGSVKVYLTCDKCAIKTNLYFTVSFENQEISKITYDSRLMFPETNPTKTLSEFVLQEKIVINKNNHSLSFDTGSSNIKYDRIDNNMKCYVPLSEIVIRDEDCSQTNKIDKVINEPRPVHVFVEVSQFNNYNQSSGDGGAIHLVDCCLTCTETPFSNCVSKDGGGGAIYIKNELDYTNNITLTDLTFTDCEAKYGGAVYIYSESLRIKVQVINCIFRGNHLIENSDSEITGGSALFLNTRNSNVDGCQFSNNYGSDSVFRILTSFKKKTIKGSIRKSELDLNSVIINECKFKANFDSKSMIQFVIGNGASNVEVRKCVFTGSLGNDAHFIDEQILDANAPLLKIKACKFSYDIKKSLKLDPKHDPSLIDFNDQVFNYSEFNESKSSSKWKLIVAIALPAVAVVSIFVLIAVIIIKKKGTQNSDEQDNTELTSNLIDSSLI